MGPEEGRLPEQLQSEAHAGGHGTKAVVVALLANLGIAVAKFVGYLVTGASSMLAEAIHSVADSGNQAMLLAGGRLARREADPNHPFGHGRVRYFAAFLVAVVLFTLGSLFSLYEGYQKLRHPNELETPSVALAILAVALLLEGLSLRTAVREADPLRGDQSWWSFIRTTKNPELAVVLLEDTAAQLGLSLALWGRVDRAHRRPVVRRPGHPGHRGAAGGGGGGVGDRDVEPAGRGGGLAPGAGGDPPHAGLHARDRPAAPAAHHAPQS